MDVEAWDAYVDTYGHAPQLGPDGTPIEEMSFPVRCLCGKVYDLGAVTVTQRYADYSVWKAPCCGRTSDGRRWKSLPDYTELRPGGRRRRPTVEETL